MTQLTSTPQRKLAAIYCLFLILTSCDNSPPYGQIYLAPEFEYFTQLAPINDSSWVSVGSRRPALIQATVGIYKYMDADFRTVWEKSYGGEVFEMGGKIIAVDNGFILFGLTKFSDARDGDSRVALLDTLGREVWNTIIGGKGNDRLFGAVAAIDSGYLLVGSTAGDASVGFNGWLVKLDNEGKELWTRSFGRPENIKGDYFSSIQRVKTGGYIISGYTASYGAGRFDGWLVKIDDHGKEEWSRTYGGVGKDFIGQPHLLDDGGFLIAGSPHQPEEKKVGWLFKTNSQGTEVWSQYYDEIEGIKSLVPYQSGGYLLLANIKASENAEYNIWICRIDKWGDKVWAKELGGKERDSASAIYESSTGYTIIAHTRSFGGQGSNWIIDLDSQGNPQ